jgi:PAS domain S-box-containing protein
MARPIVTPTDTERTFAEDDIIVSKTDAKGIITYANKVFLDIADYEEEEVLGQPHNLIRHPDMPRCIFKLLWDTLQAGSEIFAYVKNMTKHGDFYWVFAHVTPSFDASGTITGYHSNRRVPRREALAVIEPVYKDLLATEAAASGPREGLQAAYDKFSALLTEKKMAYDEFIFSF